MLRPDLGDVFLTIISKSRPHRVEPMTSLVGAATWVVPSGEREEYLAAGAPRVIEQARPGVAAARNDAITAAILVDVVILDDDLRYTERVEHRRTSPLGPALALTELVRRGRESGLEFAAASINGNALYVTRPESRFNRINGGALWISSRSRLRFDETLGQNEDLDYALQHIFENGGALRLDNLHFAFDHYQPGGMTEARALGAEAAGDERLLAKWPGVARLSRSGEATFRVRRTRGSP